jgi:hypothetical protein
MASGIHASANRPKLPKHLRSAGSKKFRNDNDEARTKYRAKMAARAARRLKKSRRKK